MYKWLVELRVWAPGRERRIARGVPGWDGIIAGVVTFMSHYLSTPVVFYSLRHRWERIDITAPDLKRVSASNLGIRI